jgi:hypothetical protein
VETDPPVRERSILAKIFLSPDEPRLRAGWRLLAQTLLLFGLILVLAIPLGLLTLFTTTDRGFLIVLQAAELLAVTGSILLARIFLDRRSISSLGLKWDRGALTDLTVGTAIPLVMMGMIYWLEWSLGWLTFEGFAWDVENPGTVAFNMAGMFLFFILVGWNEELLSRGYHLQTIASGTNRFWGVILSSLIFGLLHIGNPNATWVSAAGIFLAGLFMAYAYLRTGQLWLSIGLHIGWNFFEGPVFGFPVSGLNTFHSTHITVTGPELWTGGAFGPEAGLIVLPALLVGTILVWACTRNRRFE